MKMLFGFLLVGLLCGPQPARADMIDSVQCPQPAQIPLGPDGYSPGNVFHHTYNIENTGECDLVVTKIKKVWSSKNATEGKRTALVKIGIKEGIYSTKPSGEIVYDVDYRIKPHTMEEGFTINFFTATDVKDDEIYTCFIYYGSFEDSTCKQNHFDKQFIAGKTTAAVRSAIEKR